ncbi:MAG: hypothetical protein Aurels2KO_24160 [Aureliella sp.]
MPVIRQPISTKTRIGLGIASVLVMVAIYTLLSSSRQRAAKQEMVSIAQTRLEELSTEYAELDGQLASLGEGEDDPAREAVETRLTKLAEDVDKFTLMRDAPDKQDRTVPSWSMLYKDGLIRSLSEQGAFKRKEVWLYKDFFATGLRLLVALLLGVFVSVVLGLLMGCFDPVDAFFMPPFSFLSKVPATAVLPIFFVIIQINFSMYVAIIVFGMLPSLAQAVSASVRKDVPEELVFKAYTLGASQMELIWNVILRQILPRVLDAIRLQIGPALVLLVAAEWMVAGEGIGYRLRLFYQRTDMTVVFVYVVLLGLIGLAVDYGLIWLRRRMCPWFGD